MKILLTGSTGFVGKQLTLSLLEDGHDVYALVRNQKKAENLVASTPFHLREHLHLVEGDITRDHAGIAEDMIRSLTQNIHAVYHMAAFLSFHKEDKEKTFKINYEGTKNILELARRLKVKHFFHVSTAYTLGKKFEAREELHSVDLPFNNYYEESKCQAEHLALRYKDFFNVSIFRPSIIIGDSRTGKADSAFALYGIIRSFDLLKRRMDRQKSPIKNFKFLCNPEIPQNFVPVDYVVKVLSAALNHAEDNTIYHITNSNPPTNQKICDMIRSSLDIWNVEVVPTSYQGELTAEETRFNEPISVFYPYWERAIEFFDHNTRRLLKEANLKPLDLTEDMLKKIVSGSKAAETEVFAAKG
ncbi:short-chain dehydrogenase [Mesobacillus campisalis]|uniref:Short-chain dehydrogenase n=1 Tax=Mesobacillus campisalis TaxID=1408103 RepID=A0A0M2SWZ8_9BACI|nr:SDR family oxidoreductase [Mesobacillus campisalis]KKK37492.1 short-chain dehydrogenase [Mesobacillus campisalis]